MPIRGPYSKSLCEMLITSFELYIYMNDYIVSHFLFEMLMVFSATIFLFCWRVTTELFSNSYKSVIRFIYRYLYIPSNKYVDQLEPIFLFNFWRLISKFWKFRSGVCDVYTNLQKTHELLHIICIDTFPGGSVGS